MIPVQHGPLAVIYMQSMLSKGPRYYDVFDDVRKYPDAVIIVAYSRRGVGKTYGALYGALKRKEQIVYIKRTIDDINLICSANDAFDTSPYVPINRDHGTNIKPKKVANGIGAFYHMDDNGEPIGAPVAYAVALSAIKNVKGIDLSNCKYMIFDEFIPQISETRVLHTEGQALLDVYATISRDREKRSGGAEFLRLLLFANAENIYCPVVDELQIMDALAVLAVSGKTYNYIESRGILLHHVNEIAIEESEKGAMYKAMYGTAWHRKAFGGEFSNNDFSNIDPKTLKKYKPIIECHYRESYFYIYQRDRDYYICKQRSNKCPVSMDLNRDNDVRKFYMRFCLDIIEACTDGHVKFSDYSLYDLIIHFDKRFKNVL